MHEAMAHYALTKEFVEVVSKVLDATYLGGTKSYDMALPNENPLLSSPGYKAIQLTSLEYEVPCSASNTPDWHFFKRPVPCKEAVTKLKALAKAVSKKSLNGSFEGGTNPVVAMESIASFFMGLNECAKFSVVNGGIDESIHVEIDQNHSTTSCERIVFAVCFKK